VIGRVFVEGHGEVAAAGNLIGRLWAERDAPYVWAPPDRMPKLHLREGVEKAAKVARAQGAAGLLLLRDEDDACPKQTGPQAARWLADLDLPFPSAIVMFYREYEVLFLACIDELAGKPFVDGGRTRPGIPAGTRFEGDLQQVRGVKEWLSKRLGPSRAYKPTLDQLPLTRMLPIETLRSRDVPCFGTLERALDHLATGGPGTVWPPPAP
jgi:hypothetical protein